MPPTAKQIMVIGPAGRTTQPNRLKPATDYFESRQWAVQLHSTTDPQGFQRFGGTDAQRLASIEQASNSAADIVMLSRGGYGLSRLLHAINYSALSAAQRRGQYWVGYSDFTAMQLAGLAKTNWKSIAGPSFLDEWADEPVDSFSESNFWGIINHRQWEAEFPAISTCGFDPSQNTQGAWAGTLWGGNLAMVTSLLGTPFFPDIDGGILFLEDTNEQPFRIERMLLQLQHAGVLDRQSALVLGDFGGVTLGEHERGFNLQVVQETVQAMTKTPILSGLPFGHCKHKLSLPVGGQCELISALSGGAAHLAMRFTGY